MTVCGGGWVGVDMCVLRGKMRIGLICSGCVSKCVCVCMCVCVNVCVCVCVCVRACWEEECELDLVALGECVS